MLWLVHTLTHEHTLTPQRLAGTVRRLKSFDSSGCAKQQFVVDLLERRTFTFRKSRALAESELARCWPIFAQHVVCVDGAKNQKTMHILLLHVYIPCLYSYAMKIICARAHGLIIMHVVYINTLVCVCVSVFAYTFYQSCVRPFQPAYTREFHECALWAGLLDIIACCFVLNYIANLQTRWMVHELCIIVNNIGRMYSNRYVFQYK